MRVPRLYAPIALAEGGEYLLPQDASDHALRVLRLRAGERLSVFDGAGHEFVATLLGAHGKLAQVHIGAAVVAEPPSPLRVTLMQGIARGERMDLIVQKATELGVARIVPVLCARSVVQLDAKQRERRHEHWHSIIVAACEQSGRAELPDLAPVTALELALDQPMGPEYGLRLTLDPAARTSFTQRIAGERALTLLVGPEGGLDDMEIGMAATAGFIGVGLGPRVLRTETAPLAALAIAQAQLGDLR